MPGTLSPRLCFGPRDLCEGLAHKELSERVLGGEVGLPGRERASRRSKESQTELGKCLKCWEG